MKSSRVRDYLIGLEGDINYLQLVGNAGDSLIASGTHSVFDTLEKNVRTLNFKDIATGEKFPHLVVAGGGSAFVNFWSDYFLYESILTATENIVFLPQSVMSSNVNLDLLRSTDFLFLRDKTSLSIVREAKVKCSFDIDFDMAFNADIQKLKSLDRCCSKSSHFPTKADLKLAAYREFHRVNSKITNQLVCLRDDREKFQNRQAPRKHLDISQMGNVGLLDFGREYVDSLSVNFLKTIDFYDAVVTDRLHVVIGAWLLGKSNIQYMDNMYGKISSVVEFADLNNVENIT